MAVALKIVDSGTKKGLSRLRKNVLISLCELKTLEITERPTVSNLLEILEQWVGRFFFYPDRRNCLIVES